MADVFDVYDEDTGLSDEELEELMRGGRIPYEEKVLAAQRAQAAALRGTAMPEMRGTGRMQTAANPLEFLSAGLDRYKGHKDLQKIDEKLSGLGEQQSSLDRLAAIAARRKRKQAAIDTSGVQNILSNIPPPTLDDEEDMGY